MQNFIYENLNHIFCAFIFIARLADILTAYHVSPENKLEADPLFRKYWWLYAISTLFLCLVPYFYIRPGAMIMVLFLLLSYSNISRLWAVSALGEEDYDELMLVAGRKSKISSAISYLALSDNWNGKWWCDLKID